MQTETIEIPASVDEMRIKHLPFLLALLEFRGMEPDDIPIPDITRLNSMFTGLPMDKLRRYKEADLRRLFVETTYQFTEYESKPLPLQLVYNKQKYTLRIDFTEHPVDWKFDLIDAEAGFKDDPIDIVSFCYIEDGMAYGESTEQQTQKNPRSARNNAFREHLPLSTFLDIQGFFLASWIEFRPYLIQAKLKRARLRKNQLSL